MSTSSGPVNIVSNNEKQHENLVPTENLISQSGTNNMTVTNLPSAPRNLTDHTRHSPNEEAVESIAEVPEHGLDRSGHNTSRESNPEPPESTQKILKVVSERNGATYLIAVDGNVRKHLRHDSIIAVNDASQNTINVIDISKSEDNPDQEIISDVMKPSPDLARSRKSSYHAHTQASKAKQTDKVDLDLLRKYSSGAKKELLSLTNLPQRSATVLDDKNKRLSPSLPRDQQNSLSSSPVLALSRRDSSIDDAQRSRNMKQAAHVINRLNESSSRSASSVNHESGTMFSKRCRQEELAHLKQDTDPFEIGLDASTGDRDGYEVDADDVSWNLPNEVHEETQMQYEEVKAPLTTLQQGTCDVEVGRYNKEHKAANLLEMNEESQAGHEPQRLSSNFVISDSNKAVLVEDRALREKIAELKQESKVRSEDLVQANKNLRTSDETLERLRGDIENLMNAIHQMSQTSSDRMFNAKTFQDMTQNTDLCPGTNKLLSVLTQLTEQLEIQIQSLSSGTEQIQLDPENKELQLIVALNSFSAGKESIINNALEKTPIHEVEGGYWEKLYKEERKLKEHADRKIESLKNAARKTYHPDLERHIRELQIELTETQDEKDQLQEQVEKYSARAQQWEGEYKTVRTRAEKESAGLQQAIEQREVEMRAYIKDYHDKTKEQDHWNLKGLQNRIKMLEYDQIVTDKLFNDTKTEKARLEDEISRLVDIITAYKEENKKLIDAWGLSGVVPTCTSKPSKVASKTSPSSSESQSNLHKPPYHYANVTEKRLVKLKELLDKQEKYRREDAAIEAMLEKARARKMGKELYKKRGWSQFLGKKSWSIWDGDGWVNNTDGEKHADGANEEEYDRVQVWREKSVLPPWEEVY